MKPTPGYTAKPAIGISCTARSAQMAHDRPCRPASRISTAANPNRYVRVPALSPPPTAPTTGSASSTTIASRISVPAVTPRKLFHGSGFDPPGGGAGAVPRGDHRTGDDDACSGKGLVLGVGVVDQRGGGIDGVAQAFGGDHPIGPEVLLRDQRQRFHVRCSR